MQEALRLAAFAVIAALLTLTVRASRPEAGTMVALAAGAMLLVAAVSRLSEAAQALSGMADRLSADADTVKTLMKLLGIAYLTEFAAQACRDAGETGIAAKTELCGKCALFLLSLPLLENVATLAASLSP